MNTAADTFALIPPPRPERPTILADFDALAAPMLPNEGQQEDPRPVIVRQAVEQEAQFRCWPPSFREWRRQIIELFGGADENAHD